MDLPVKKRMLVPLNNPRRPTFGTRFVTAILRAVFVPLGFVLGNLYKLCFGWWLDKRLAKRDHERLERDIRNHLAFLFSECSAEIVPDQGFDSPPSFDYAGVTLALGSVRLRFVRGRGDLNVSVASAFAPDCWEDLRLVADGFAKWETTRPVPYSYSLDNMESILRPRLATLQTALSKENFEKTLQQAVVTHNQAVDAYAARLNRAGIVPKFY